MKLENFRKIFAVLTAGIVWFVGILLFFVLSGAQNILANPDYQSRKFLTAFNAEPLPRMAENPVIVPAGLILAGSLTGLVFWFLNSKLDYRWLQKGLVFGLIHWALMIPWFEFYLPYNVMREPVPLVLLEMFLWIGVTLLVGIYLSFMFNFKRKPKPFRQTE